MNEIRHGHDGTDVANIISKEDTSKTGKSTHEVSLEGDGSLDTASIGSRYEGTHDDSVSNRNKDDCSRICKSGRRVSDEDEDEHIEVSEIVLDNIIADGRSCRRHIACCNILARMEKGHRVAGAPRRKD